MKKLNAEKENSFKQRPNRIIGSQTNFVIKTSHPNLIQLFA